MRPSKACVVLSLLLAAGCASSPEVADEAAVAAPSLAAAPSAPSAPSSSTETIVPDTVIDANELIANTPPPPICRQVLKMNSNVHERRCMSAEHWKMWDQAEARRAAELLRTWQGSAFR